ncbi:MAG TPA: VOC family protein [Steroidobacteraceae bacterium]|nr:VOC family protein [Steroidobacteraceae bacterium]
MGKFAATVLATLWLGVATAAIAATAATPTPAQSTTPVAEVDSVAMTVGDMDRSIDFYSRVLTFQKESDREVSGDDYEHLFNVFGLRIRAVRMRLGDEHIELLQFLAPRGRPVPVDSRSNDRWFQHVAIIVSDMAMAYARLRSFRVEYASSGPQRLPEWNPNAGGIEAFYFRDPDGHNLEILAFPPGKGEARWHAHDGRLFLGIDHTAIVVADTEASLRFYRDQLGLRIAGTSDNYGTEQEHLNNVFGAHLRITSLRAPHGPGVEFLEYVAPGGGRAIPADTRANDLWYWQINFRTAGRLEPQQVTRLHDMALGWPAALIARDPDGHASLISSTRPIEP